MSVSPSTSMYMNYFQTKLKKHTIDQSIKCLHCFIENLALRKSAWQLNPIDNDFKHSANNAVDGKKSDLSELGGECTASSSSRTTAMWWVDLGTLQSIHHVIIQYSTGNQVWGNFHPS